MLYYKKYIQNTFRVDIQLYQHKWKLKKRKIVATVEAKRAPTYYYNIWLKL